MTEHTAEHDIFVAHHEAGHAVVAALFDIKVEHVTLEPDHEDAVSVKIVVASR